MTLTPAQWVKRHRHDELRGRLEKLAESWDKGGRPGLTTASDWGPDVFAMCAQELREALG